MLHYPQNLGSDVCFTLQKSKAQMYALISKTLRGNIAKGKLLDIYRFINLPDSITVNPVGIRPQLVGI